MKNDKMSPPKKSFHHPHGRLHDNYWQSVPNILLNDVRDKKLSPTDIVVYMGFADHVRGNDNCFVSNRTVAKLLGCSTKTVERSVKSLAKAGRVERSNHRTERGTKTTRLLVRVGANGVINLKPDPGNGLKINESAQSEPSKPPLNQAESLLQLIGVSDDSRGVDTPPEESEPNQSANAEDKLSVEYLNEREVQF